MNTVTNETALPFPAVPEDDKGRKTFWRVHPDGLGGMIRSAGWAIFLCGLYGTLWGAIAGAAIGTCFFPVVGTIVGAVCGMLFGFLAGLVGATLGGRWGGAIGGGVGGIAGGMALCLIGSLLRPNGTGGYTAQIPALVGAALFVPALIGGFLGFSLGKKLEPDAPPHNGLAGDLHSKLKNSALYLLPWWIRVLIGVMVGLSIAAIIAQFRAWGGGIR